MVYSAALLAVVAAAAGVSAHGGVGSYTFGGKTYTGHSPYNSAAGQSTIQRPYSSFDPILNPSGANIRCNNNGQAAALHADIAAGSKITATWTQWTHAEGPVTVWLSKCPGSDCSSYDGSGDWFKIDEAGLLSGTISKGEWGNGIVLKTLKWESTIPASIQSGAYLIRHEVLALHQANTPQFYPECAQLKITGGGSDFPSSQYLAKLPGAFKLGDSNISVNINSDTSTTYIVPGPPVWKGGAGSGTGTTPVPTSTVTSTPVTSTPPTSTSSPTPVPSSGNIPKYGQCGGNGWSGSGSCASGSTCVKSNDYYSQCL
jgi:cellulase